MKDNLRIYGVKDSYIKYLSQYQEHLFRHEGGSSGRKYIGVVFEINKFSYFVPKGQLVELNINAEKDPHYKFLLQAENREINKQKSRIRKNAEIVYNHKKRNGNLTPLAKRTNDFEMLEKLSRDFL
jgi:protein AbiQ